MNTTIFFLRVRSHIPPISLLYSRNLRLEDSDMLYLSKKKSSPTMHSTFDLLVKHSVLVGNLIEKFLLKSGLHVA